MNMPLGLRLLFGYFRIFHKYVGNRILLICLLTLLMGWAEGLGIALFFPLFGAEGRIGNDALSHTLGTVLRVLHVPPTPTGALPLIAILLLSKAVLQFATITAQQFSSTRLARQLRSRLIDGLGGANYLHVMRGTAGALANLLTNEVPRATYGYLYYVRALPPGVNVIVFVTIVVLLDWKLALLCLAAGVITGLILRSSGLVASRYSQVTTKENGALTHLLVQTVHAFKYIRATAAFSRFRVKLDRSAERLAHADYRSSLAWAFSQSISQPIMLVLMVGLMYYRVALRHESLASLFVLLAYFFRISTELFNLQSYWQSFSSYIGSVDAVEAALSDLHREREPHGSRPFVGWSQRWRAEAVHFAYSPDKEVLRDINVTIARSSMVAFVGESGSGKSTLVDLLTGTLKPTAGRVTFDGQDLADMDTESLRRTVGYVPQESTVFDDTVANNITLWTSAEPERIEDAARRAKCLEFVRAMPRGFESEIGERGVRLSGGQRQRLAIAREIFKQPDILVLDEATSALDSESERAIQESIEALKGQMTIVVIAHRLSTIRKCDYLYVLKDGRIVEEGTCAGLLERADSQFRRMCELQALTGDLSQS